jgi:ABC-type ATPase involved in cell division
MLVLKNVSVARGKRKVLSGVNLTVEPGEFVCILGKSGSGKTTVMELLAGLRRPDSGTVEVDGVDLHEIPEPALQLYRRRLGIVFEDGKLIPYRTVAENVAFPLEICGAPENVIEKRVKEALKKVDLSDRDDELPDHLSADERVRVGIARSIAHKPLIIMADEPLALLDSDEASHVRSLLKEIHQGGATVVVFTHDADTMKGLATRTIELTTKMAPIATPKKSEPVPTHDVFEKMPVAAPMPAPAAFEKSMTLTPAEPEAAKSEEHASETPKKAGGRKIRVTSIHSD